MAFGVTGLLGTLPFVCSSNIVNTFKDVNRAGDKIRPPRCDRQEAGS